MRTKIETWKNCEDLIEPNYKFKNWQEEIVWLRGRNKELLEACNYASNFIKTMRNENLDYYFDPYVEAKINQAISKAEQE